MCPLNFLKCGQLKPYTSLRLTLPKRDCNLSPWGLLANLGQGQVDWYLTTALREI